MSIRHSVPTVLALAFVSAFVLFSDNCNAHLIIAGGPPPTATTKAPEPTPAPCSTPGLERCFNKNYFYEELPCYNKTAGENCCGVKDWACSLHKEVKVCEADQPCCMPAYGCDTGAHPACCPAGSTCCNSGRHGVDCAPPGDKCCPTHGYSSSCPTSTKCCSGYYESQCCTDDQECCLIGQGGQLVAQCCNPGQHCSHQHGCVSDACKSIANSVVKGSPIDSTVTNSSDACCSLCAENEQCKAAVVTLMKPSLSEHEAFVRQLSVFRGSRSAKRQLLSSLAPAPRVLCELMSSDAVVPAPAGTPSLVLVVKRQQ